MNSRRLIHSITSSAAIRGTVVTELFSRDRARIVYMCLLPLHGGAFRSGTIGAPGCKNKPRLLRG
jgi:hypothetical protein